MTPFGHLGPDRAHVHVGGEAKGPAFRIECGDGSRAVAVSMSGSGFSFASSFCDPERAAPTELAELHVPMCDAMERYVVAASTGPFDPEPIMAAAGWRSDLDGLYTLVRSEEEWLRWLHNPDRPEYVREIRHKEELEERLADHYRRFRGEGE